MAVSKIVAEFEYPVDRVWDVVTDFERYGWRSDLSRTEKLGQDRFIEYTKEGFATVFKVTAAEENRRWELDLDNENMRGRWVGLFSVTDGGTRLEFAENVNAKKFLLRPFIKAYLKKQQVLFMEDLKKELTR